MLVFLVIAFVTLATAAVAMSLRNLIHSALLLIASWAGIAAFYLWAGAEFVAFGQVLVYVGAVSMVVLFAVLLTRHSREDQVIAPDSFGRFVAAFLAGGTVFGILLGAVLAMPATAVTRVARGVTVKDLGRELMGTHAAALLVIGVILTVALLGAIVLAATDRAVAGKGRP
ncbi:MAG TPA: NADH-quinone oxidoreductase subunit J [Opitutaceae bacterium]|nr:NADH-quinone oxidoreductase subunit J [Opitutaceae bacterium]